VSDSSIATAVLRGRKKLAARTRRSLSAGELAAVDLASPGALMRIEVTDNQVEAALKTLKKQMQKAGLFQEMKRRAHYEKPSAKRKRKQALARKKRRRALQRTSRFETE
jgi:small subunit ribosomal protein S21